MAKLTRLLNREFEDRPDQHTLTLIEWQNEASLDLFTQFKAGGFLKTSRLARYQLKLTRVQNFFLLLVLITEGPALSHIFLES